MSAATKDPRATMKPGMSHVTTPGDKEIRIERVLKARRERVWKAFTERALVAQWWGRGNKLDIEEMDFREGGTWRFVEHSDHGDNLFWGRYKKIVPIERIDFTFAFPGSPGEGDCVWEFHDLGDGTTLLVDRALIGSKEGVEAVLKSGMLEGANQSLAALDRVLATLG